jgi:hypothetical protein
MNFTYAIQKFLSSLADSRPAQQAPKHSNPWGAVLRYQGVSKGGNIFFESPSGTFDMWWEFEGGVALATVDIPTEAEWEARTKLPVSARQAVLQFIGNQIVADKISSKGSFAIGESLITFYAG